MIGHAYKPDIALPLSTNRNQKTRDCKKVVICNLQCVCKFKIMTTARMVCAIVNNDSILRYP